jgi:transcriptional regulator with XRE-family HTH domain
MTDFKKCFGKNLKKIRKRQGLTQEQLAELVDLHYRQMSKIETGENFPSGKTIERLCHALRVSPSILFNFDIVFSNELVKTGTDDLIFYKAVKKNNILMLRDYQGINLKEQETSALDSEKKISDMASNIGKIITVEFFENDIRTKVLEYHPNGEVKTIKDENLNNNKDSNELLSMFLALDDCHEYVEFIKLAIQSLDDNSALERLEHIINGIKLARKNR